MLSIKKKIKKNLHKFDIISLLCLLNYYGYKKEDILFKSNFSNASPAKLIEKIEFFPDSIYRVIITLNLGLLSAQTPIPMYFFKRLLSQNIEANIFADFIDFIDDFIIKQFFLFTYIENNPELFPDYHLTLKYNVLLLDFNSCATLYWIFSIVFPDIEKFVVENAILNKDIVKKNILLGKSILGKDVILGAKTQVPANAKVVTLYVEEEKTNKDVDWTVEANNRLDKLIFPLLRLSGVDLEIFLIIPSQKGWAKLNSESYLGYDKIKGGIDKPRRIKLFTGRVN